MYTRTIASVESSTRLVKVINGRLSLPHLLSVLQEPPVSTGFRGVGGRPRSYKRIFIIVFHYRPGENFVFVQIRFFGAVDFFFKNVSPVPCVNRFPKRFADFTIRFPDTTQRTRPVIPCTHYGTNISVTNGTRF